LFNDLCPYRSIDAAYVGAAIYSLSIIPKRIDAFVFIDSTMALHPMLHLGSYSGKTIKELRKLSLNVS
jgi:hypothetical protein